MSTDSQHSSLQPPTIAARRFVRYVSGFGVAVALGMAPFLGQVQVPGFTALLDLLPATVQWSAVPISALMMGLTAVIVQHVALGGRSSRRRLTSALRACVVICVIGVFSLLWLYSQHVVSIPVEDKRIARFLVTASRRPECRCPVELSDEECIARLSFQPGAVASCFDSKATRQLEFAFVVVYVLTLVSFAGSVACLVVAPAQKRPK